MPTVLLTLLTLVTLMPQGTSLKPAAYVARGTEPGWVLTLTGRHASLSRQDGGKVEFDVLAPVTTGAVTKYAGASRADAAITVTHGLCHDGMSGMSYPDAVAVALGGKTLKGCGGDPASVLEGAWVVTSIAGVAVKGDAAPSLLFSTTGTVSGSTGCNRFTTGYALTGEGLTLKAVAVTKMLCPPAQQGVEDAFLKALDGVFRHDVTDAKTLVLENRKQQKIVATRK